ncbi:MAG: hypothetical protein F6J93_26610 [Oscillatoria sp. SIO1A7]|nr:hypothetical protein [Oscillatoria sp. SIO1A7]
MLKSIRISATTAIIFVLGVVALGVALVIFALGGMAEAAKYPASANNIESNPPICYIEQADGTTLDLSQMCGSSEESELNPIVQIDGGTYLPAREASSQGCICPYDLKPSGRACGRSASFAEGSPVCYRREE